MTSIRHSIYRYARRLSHALALSALAAACIGLLWLQETRAVRGSTQRDTTWEADRYRCLFSSRVDRQEYMDLDRDVIPLGAPKLGDPDGLKQLLPEGQAYDIVVKGGFVAQRATTLQGGSSRRHMAYAFEMNYRRVIESNDGHRVVERRSFGPVRMAKIFSSATNMQLQLGPSGQLLFSGVVFPKPGMGITPTASVALANTLLTSSSQNSVNHAEASLSMAEKDPLSGKAVRITHVDGIGVESVECLGGALTVDQLDYFFSQSLLPEQLLAIHNGKGTQQVAFAAQQLAAFSDPGRRPWDDLRVGVERLDGSSENEPIFGVYLVPDEEAFMKGRNRPSANDLLGKIQFSREGTHIEQASFQWSLSQLTPCRSRLLFERAYRDFTRMPVIFIDYHCRPTENELLR